MKEIDSSLQSLQAEVGGYIGAAYPFRDPVALVCNDEGKLIGLDLNRGLRDENGKLYDIMVGTFLVVGLGEEDFASLSPELAQKYMEHFRQPEQFINLNGRIVVLPLELENPKRSSVREKLGEAKRECDIKKSVDKSDRKIKRIYDDR